jgi:hypothetical protein
LRQAALERELRVIIRCLKNARENLRDVQGEINRAASIDLRNCGLRLKQLERKMAKLGKAAERLAQEAREEAIAFANQLERQQQSQQSSSSD